MLPTPKPSYIHQSADGVACLSYEVVLSDGTCYNPNPDTGLSASSVCGDGKVKNSQDKCVNLCPEGS